MWFVNTSQNAIPTSATCSSQASPTDTAEASRLEWRKFCFACFASLSLPHGHAPQTASAWLHIYIYEYIKVQISCLSALTIGTYWDRTMQWHCNRILCLRCIVTSIFLMVLVSPRNRKSDQRVQRLNIQLGSLLLRWPGWVLKHWKDIKGIKRQRMTKDVVAQSGTCQTKQRILEMKFA